MESIGRGPGENKKQNGSPSKIHFLFGLIIGTGTAVVLAAVGLLSIPLALLTGFGGFIAGSLVFRPITGKKKELPDYSRIDGVTHEIHEQALREGRLKLSKLRAYTDRIQDRSIQIKARNIGLLTEKILDTIEKDPKDLKPSRSFLNYYLDAVLKILNQYNEMSTQKIGSKDVEQLIVKVDGTLTALEQACEKHLKRLMENDLLDLDTELTVLQRTIEMEGFGKDK